MNGFGVQVMVTGTAWLGGGFGAIETAMRDYFKNSSNEILITVFSITSANDFVMSLIEETLSRGVRIRMVVNRLQDQAADASSALKSLAKRYRHFELYDFSHQHEDADLHAKVIVFDRRSAIVGSSNLSRRGLITAQELAVSVHDQAAEKVAEAFDRLLRDRACSRIFSGQIA